MITALPYGAFRNAWVSGLPAQRAISGAGWDEGAVPSKVSEIVRTRLALLDGPLAPLWHSRVSELIEAVIPAIELSCRERAEPFTVRELLLVGMSVERVEQLAAWIRREHADKVHLALAIEAYLARLPGYRPDPLVRSEDALREEHAYIASKLPQLLEG